MKHLVWQLAVHEWRLISRQRWIMVALTLYAGLLVGALIVGASWRHQWQTRTTATQQTEAQLWTALRKDLGLYRQGRLVTADFAKNIVVKDTLVFPDDPYIVGFYGKIAHVLPVGTLAELSIGQSDVMPTDYLLSTRPMRSVIFNEESSTQQNPLGMLLGRLDAAFLIIYLLPLIVIALTYDAVATDRENGTLALVMTNPISKRLVLVSRTAARLALPVTITLVFCAIGHLLIAGWQHPVRLVEWSGAVMLYSLFWGGLAMLLERWRPSSTLSALILSLVWIAVVAVLPALIQQAAATMHPVPSRAAAAERARAAEMQPDTTLTKRADLRVLFAAPIPDLPAPPQALYDRLPHPETGEQQFNRQAIVQTFAKRRVADLYNIRLEARIDEAGRRQADLVHRLAVLSPALLMRYAFDRLAGTDDDRLRAFTRSAVECHMTLRLFYVRYLLTNIPMTPADLDRVPHCPAQKD